MALIVLAEDSSLLISLNSLQAIRLSVHFPSKMNGSKSNFAGRKQSNVRLGYCFVEMQRQTMNSMH